MPSANLRLFHFLRLSESRRAYLNEWLEIWLSFADEDESLALEDFAAQLQDEFPRPGVDYKALAVALRDAVTVTI